MIKDLSEDEDDSQDENQGLTARDTEFELDDDIDPVSPFLHSMVSDK